MTEPAVRDGYEQWYSDKLWALVPAVHRAADSEVVDGAGPLRELLDRVAASAAVLRRGIDRLWEDQSIESCDTWVVPYLADLPATNLVPSMDSRAQRLDVANTIRYRRRKGTVALLEELAHDVTGYEARAIEFFRQLARARHGLDPPIGRPADTADPPGSLRLQRVARLTDPFSGTPAGGWADLRHPLGAALTGTAYDGFGHRADVRAGRGALGWYGIAKVGFFLWRSASLRVDVATPVPVQACPGYFAFDPTGRQTPLFTAAARSGNDYGENWVPVDLSQLPQPLTTVLWEHAATSFWPASLSASTAGTGQPLALTGVTVWPEVGRFKVGAVPAAGLDVSYHHGLFSRIGAGPYDRRRIGVDTPADPPPVTHLPGGTAVLAAGPAGTVLIDDGRTIPAVTDVAVQTVTIRAADLGRAVIRTAPGGQWVLTGGAGAALRLEGLLISGADLVLRGRFDTVEISCCTLDPGSPGGNRTPAAVWESAVDGRELSPVNVWVEGAIGRLIVDRSITGPIRTRGQGLIESLEATDSVLQALPTELPGELTALRDADSLRTALGAGPGIAVAPVDPLSQWLTGRPVIVAALAPAQSAQLIAALTTVIAGPLIWTAERFAGRPLRDSTLAAALAAPTGAARTVLNRQLLAEAYPLALADAAVATAAGTVRLTRCTVLGPAYVHRLECSESILDGVVRVGDAQTGCVRFSGWSRDSALPRRYESVEIAAGAPVMVSRRYGEWGYAQLTDSADTAVLGGNTGGRPSLLTGSHDGSEMGVFCRDAAAVKDRSLLIKLQEFLPVGLSPVIVHLPAADPDGETTRGRPWPPT
ncbi:hypothetical protein [Actinoplanes sp. NPDC026619]|uniref:hypothetical protein n=1 Tax=Actinoplanes sp. NPDC026619 TaxID=3155798 RepID=UPI00340D5D94